MQSKTLSPTLPEIPSFKDLLGLISKNKQKQKENLIRNNVGHQTITHLLSSKKKVIWFSQWY